MEASRQEYPYEIKDVEPELAKELMEHYKGEKTGFVKVGPKGYFLPHLYKHQAADIYNMQIRPDDIFVQSFPRSGTTLTQELVWLINNNLDYEKARTIPIYRRFPMLEFSLFLHPETEKEFIEKNKDNENTLKFLSLMTAPSVEITANQPSPRFIKTHLPLSLLPPTLLDTAKMVYVVRDPRDVAVSLYHLNRLLRIINAVKDFKTHWNYFIRGLSYWAPYFENVKEAWSLRNHPNLLFIFYEDLINDKLAVLRRVTTFFGKTYTDQQFQELIEHLSFDNFKSNPSVGYDLPVVNFFMSDAEPFIRKGKVGGWKEYFDEEMQEQAERWIEDNLRETDLRFPTYRKK